MGLSLKWDITYKCNLMCDHCINGDYLSNSGDEVSYEEIVKIIDEISECIPIDYIHFLGGEPLTRKDFIDVLYYLESKNIKYGFNSNGLLFNKEVLQRIGHLKCFDSIVISLEGPNAEVNDKIRGKNVFNILIDRMRAVNYYKERNPESTFKLCVNTVVTAMNYEYIPDIIALCEREDVAELSLLEFIEDGNGKGKNLSLKPEQFLNVVRLVAENYTYKKGKMKIIPKFARPLAKNYANACLNLEFPDIAHGCGAGATSLFLDNHGFVYPCDRERKFNDHKYKMEGNDFWKMWNSEDFARPFSIYFGDEIYKNIIPCNQCEYLCESCFPCYLGVREDVESEMQMCRIMKEKIAASTNERGE